MKFRANKNWQTPSPKRLKSKRNMSKHTRSNLLIMNRWSVWIMSICRPKQQRALSISLSSSSIANFICHFSLNFHRFPFILISFCFYRRICKKKRKKWNIHFVIFVSFQMGKNTEYRLFGSRFACARRSKITKALFFDERMALRYFIGFANGFFILLVGAKQVSH